MSKLSSGIRNPLQVAAEDAQGGPVQWNWCHPSAWSASLSLYQLNYINLYLRRPRDSLKINSFWSRLPRAQVWPSLCFLNALSIPRSSRLLLTQIILPPFYSSSSPFTVIYQPLLLLRFLCLHSAVPFSLCLFLSAFLGSNFCLIALVVKPKEEAKTGRMKVNVGFDGALMRV